MKAQGLNVKGMDDAKMRMIFLPGMMMRIKTMVMITMARMMASTIILLRRKMTMTKMMILMGRMMMATTKDHNDTDQNPHPPQPPVSCQGGK